MRSHTRAEKCYETTWFTLHKQTGGSGYVPHVYVTDSWQNLVYIVRGTPQALTDPVLSGCKGVRAFNSIKQATFHVPIYINQWFLRFL